MLVALATCCTFYGGGKGFHVSERATACSQAMMADVPTSALTMRGENSARTGLRFTDISCGDGEIVLDVAWPGGFFAVPPFIEFFACTNLVAGAWSYIGWTQADEGATNATAAVGKETFKDTFPYVLSRHFSYVERRGEAGLEVTLMETQFRWSISNRGNRKLSREADPCEKVRLGPGDNLYFYIPGFPGGMSVAVTNGAWKSERVELPGRFADSRHLVVFDDSDCRSRGKGRETARNHRMFIYDVANAELFDVEKNGFERFDLPFQALWKDRREYMRRFSRNHSSFTLSRGARRMYSKARDCMRTGKDRIPQGEGERLVSCFSDETMPSVGRVVGLVEMTRKGTNIVMAGIAKMSTTGYEMLARYDDAGSPVLVRFRQGRNEPRIICEYDSTGQARRFVQLGRTPTEPSSFYVDGDEDTGIKVEDRGQSDAFVRSTIPQFSHLEASWRDMEE